MSLLKDQNERPKTRQILNALYLFDLPNAPKFTRNSFENFERFDSWLIQLYVKVQGAKTTAEEIIKCFLQNLEYEDVRGVINTNSITTKYWMIQRRCLKDFKIQIQLCSNMTHIIWVILYAAYNMPLQCIYKAIHDKIFNYSKTLD